MIRGGHLEREIPDTWLRKILEYGWEPGAGEVRFTMVDLARELLKARRERDEARWRVAANDGRGQWV